MGMHDMSRTALLLSGGMDSIAVAWALRPDLAITIDYGQRPAPGELRAATAVCAALALPQRILRIDCSELGSGDLAGSEPLTSAPASDWWPFRNQLLITLASTIALQDGFERIAFGAVSGDSFHSDGTHEFFKSLAALLDLQEGRIALDTPAIGYTTAAYCRLVGVPFELLAWSHSCHTGPHACGQCRGCNKHRLTMHELGYGEY